MVSVDAATLLFSLPANSRFEEERAINILTLRKTAYSLCIRVRCQFTSSSSSVMIDRAVAPICSVLKESSLAGQQDCF